VVAAWCLAVLTAACGTTLDDEDLEAQIAEQLEVRFSGSAWTVECPGNVEPEAGATFACAATSDGDQSFDIAVTQENTEGSVTWRIVE
jgi:dihydroxyacid dehydratase/phosphogluconate dehydratase